MENKSFRAALKKNAMLIVLVLVYLFFLILTQGGIFKPSSFTELINQNAYVYILGAGMLMCMLTGGNIDLSVGSFVCFAGAVLFFRMRLFSRSKRFQIPAFGFSEFDFLPNFCYNYSREREKENKYFSQ